MTKFTVKKNVACQSLPWSVIDQQRKRAEIEVALVTDERTAMLFSAAPGMVEAMKAAAKLLPSEDAERLLRAIPLGWRYRGLEDALPPRPWHGEPRDE